MGDVETGRLDQLALGPDAFKEHHQLQLEEHHRVDARSSPVGVQLPRPLPDEAQVELGVEVAVEVVSRDQVLQRDGDRVVEAAGLGRTEHPVLHGSAPRRSGRAAAGSDVR